MHNEVLEEGGQNKLGLTRLIKTFTLDLVTEYNIEVCAFRCNSKNYRRKTETQPERDLGSCSGA